MIKRNYMGMWSVISLLLAIILVATIVCNVTGLLTLSRFKMGILLLSEMIGAIILGLALIYRKERNL